MAVILYLIQKRSLITNFFVNIGNTLKIDKDKQFPVEANYVFDPNLKAIKKYSTHQSVLSIKQKMNNNVFSFRKVTYEEILNEINSLDTSESAQSEDVPLKIIKDNADIFANFILQNFNKCNIDGKFPNQLKKQTLALSLKKETIMIKPITDRYLTIAFKNL